jgi:hypothetical protein
MLQRAAITPSPVHDVLPIVHGVRCSPSQPLDAEAHAFIGRRFGITLAVYVTYRFVKT